MEVSFDPENDFIDLLLSYENSFVMGNDVYRSLAGILHYIIFKSLIHVLDKKFSLPNSIIQLL